MYARSGGGFVSLVAAVLACLVLVCVSLPTASAGNFTVWDQTDFDSCIVLLGNVSTTEYDYRFYWSIVNNSTIKMGLAAKAPGWMGVGLSTNGMMHSGGSPNNSDVWVGWVDGGLAACASAGGCVADYTVTARSQPTLDTAGNLTAHIFGTENGYKYFSFSRELVTTDPTDLPITPTRPQYLIHALGPGMPQSFTNFAPVGGSRKHIAGTNLADLVTLGQQQWNCGETAASANQTNNGFYQNPAGTWKVTWALIEGGLRMEFNISARVGAWWAMGLNTLPSMIGGDVMWCSTNSLGEGIVVDRKATEQATPARDSVQDVLLVSYEVVDGWSTCRVRRKLDTGDAEQDNVILPESMVLMWAYDAPSSKRSISKRDCPDFCQHAANTKGLVSVNFLTGETREVNVTDDKRKAHGILMLFAWGLLAVAGAFIARYCKTPQGKWALYGYVWVHLHGFLGVLTFVVNLIAFALIVSWVSDRGITHFKGAHEIIGIIMFICSFFLPIFGIIGELFLKKYKDPNWVGYLIGTAHAWFGKALVLLGLVEIYLGLALYCVPTYVMVTYGVAVGSMIALFLIHEVLRWFAPWGSWLGGPGFTYQRVDDDSGSTEMKDFSPGNKIPWMNKRAPQQPPLVVKVCLWILQVGVAVIIIGLWIATAVGIGEKDINATDSFESSCTIGTKFQ